MITVARPLRLEHSVEVSHVSHRLALGVKWLDALTQLPADGPLTSELEAIGSRPLRQTCELRQPGHHALRWAGRLAALLKIAAEDKVSAPPATPTDDQTNFVLRSFAQRAPAGVPYSRSQDPRRYVPRRVALTPIQTDGIPPAALDNIRQGWLWPGANYPLGAKTTAIRGRIRRGASMADAEIVPWARVTVSLPANILAAPDFANEPQVGWGHGDDRGEFLVVLGANAVPGGATLPTSMPLRVWVFLPPVGAFDPDHALDSLPLEQAESDAINDVLRGIAPPPGYVRQNAMSIPLSSGATVRPGATLVLNDEVLLFP